jgi:hypothetical protein
LNGTWFMPDQQQSTWPPASAKNYSPSNRKRTIVTSPGLSSDTCPARHATRQSPGADRKLPVGGLCFPQIRVCFAHTIQARALGGLQDSAGAYEMSHLRPCVRASGLHTRGCGWAARALIVLSSQTLAVGMVGLSAGTRRHTSPVLGSSLVSLAGGGDEPGSPEAFWSNASGYKKPECCMQHSGFLLLQRAELKAKL